MQTIEISRIQSELKISSPYDEELINSIKFLHYKQRRYHTSEKVWYVTENAPDQQDDQETNLEFIQRICSECALRRKWLLCDRTAQTEEQIDAAKMEASANELEAHIAAVQEVLPKLPANSLKLVSWSHDTLSLQLAHYLGEDKYDLFMELKNACQKSWKRNFFTSWDGKMTFGFVFEMAAVPEIIQELMKCQIQYLRIHQLMPTKIFDDGICHAQKTYDPIEETATEWVGIEHKTIDLADVTYTSQNYELAKINGKIYWVCQTTDYINSWLTESSYAKAYFGGPFGVFLQKKSSLPTLLKELHLENWFEQWAVNLLNAETVAFSGYGYKVSWSKGCYQHPADNLISHITRFAESAALLIEIIGNNFYNKRRLRIEELKRIAAQEAIAKSRQNAKKLAEQHLLKEYDSKQKLIDFADRTLGVGIVKKSWTKERILEALTQDQAWCEKLIGLPES